MLPGGMARLLLVILAAVMVGCDEEDPATSEHCVMVRMRFLEAKFHRDRAASLGANVSALDVQLAQLQSLNWQCFR